IRKIAANQPQITSKHRGLSLTLSNLTNRMTQFSERREKREVPKARWCVCHTLYFALPRVCILGALKQRSARSLGDLRHCSAALHRHDVHSTEKNRLRARCLVQL